MASKKKIYDIVGYLVHFQTIHYPGLWDYIISLFAIDPRQGYIFPPQFPFLEDLLINVQ